LNHIAKARASARAIANHRIDSILGVGAVNPA
jgi:hypothetical protein